MYLCRNQCIHVKGQKSSPVAVNIGSLGGCVLSAVLFILYTDDLIAKQIKCYVVKYADDTAIVGLISEGTEDNYINELKDITKWCCDSNLLLDK